MSAASPRHRQGIPGGVDDGLLGYQWDDMIMVYIIDIASGGKSTLCHV